MLKERQKLPNPQVDTKLPLQRRLCMSLSKHNIHIHVCLYNIERNISKRLDAQLITNSLNKTG